MADSGHPPAELHERLLICRTIKLNAGALGGHRRCCHAIMQKNAQNKPQIARLILCVHTTLQVYCNLFLTFCQKLLNFLNLDVSKSLKSLWDFLTSIGSFQGLLAEALEVILLPQRLALTYSTTFKRLWQVFFTSFFVFLVICIQRTVFLPVISSFLTGIFLIINIGLQARFCSAPEPLFRP